VIIFQKQQRIISFSNKIKNFNNKLENLFILFIILSSLDFESTTFFKFFFVFNFENNTLFNSINFNKSFEVIKLLDTLQNLILLQNLNLTLQRHLKFRSHQDKFINSFALLFKIIILELYKFKTYVKVITNVYYKINWQLIEQNKIKFLKKNNIDVICLTSSERYVLCDK